MTKVIWYCLHYASTPSRGTRNRPFYLSKAFQESGFQSYVIAASFHHYLNQEIKMSGDFLIEKNEEIPYIWLKTPRYKKNGLKRIINMLYFAYSLWRNEKKIVDITKKPDVIIISAPHSFCLPIALKLAKKYKAKLIFEARDLWPQALIQVNKPLRFNPLIVLMKWIEKQACKRADYVVSLLPNALAYLQTQGLAEHKFVYIPNGFGFNANLDSAEPCSTDIVDEVKKLKNQSKLIIGYLGTHGVFNALDQLIDAMAILQKNGQQHVHAILVGDGCNKKRLIKRASELKNTTFFDKIPSSQSQSFLELTDVGFIGWHALPVYHFGVSPEKVFQYMIAGKPIIDAIETLHDPPQMAGCAWVVPPNSPHAIANTIEKISQLPKSEMDAVGLKGKNYVLAHNDYRILAKKYIELF